MDTAVSAQKDEAIALKKKLDSMVKNCYEGTYLMTQEEDSKQEQSQERKLETQRWIIYNYTNVIHPFHIHVIPYQVVEVYDHN